MSIPHRDDYKKDAWKNYSKEELEWWVKLLTKRATHRDDDAKREKDAFDASVYQKMLDEYDD